ncbi:MAG: hypothetical protein AAF846_05980 [Chloroflexota bacterium]
MSDEQPNGFFNRASVVLFLVFTIPASLTLAGTYYVASQGRVPGGEDTACEVAITNETDLRLEIYAYTAGLVDFETQTVSVRTPDEEFIQLFSDTIPVPRPLTCDNVLTRLDDDNLILQNQKSLAWSNDNGQTWHVHNVCDDPRPTSRRCDAEALSLNNVALNPNGSGIMMVIESAVDEFGEPQRDAEGNPIADDQWQLSTTDYGRTWSLSDID